MLTRTTWSLAVWSLGWLAACSAYTNGTVTTDAGAVNTKASARIGPSGGTLTLTAGTARGATIPIPEGALTKPVTITMQAVEVPLRLRQGIRFTGPIVDIGPSGTVFSRPVTIA